MARSRSTSRSRKSQPATSKSPARTKSPGRKSAGAAAATPASPKSPARRTASPGRPKKTPSKSPVRGKKAAAASKSPVAKSPAAKSPGRPKSAGKTPPRPTRTKTPESTSRHTFSQSRSRTVSETSSAARTPSPVHRKKTPSSISSSHKIPVHHTSEAFHTRPRRAAAVAANRELSGVESSRLLHYTIEDRLPKATKKVKNAVSKLHWPSWPSCRDVKNHFRRHSKLYWTLLTALLVAALGYYFNRQIRKQLNVIQHTLAEIYQEQKDRLGNLWESPTEKAARESALPSPPPPHREPPPVKPPNPHKETAAKGHI